jgi:hypothetical protein
MEGTKWIARWAVGSSTPLVWTVRGVTNHGIYITCPESRSLGHLLSSETFKRDYVEAPR